MIETPGNYQRPGVDGDRVRGWVGGRDRGSEKGNKQNLRALMIKSPGSVSKS